MLSYSSRTAVLQWIPISSRRRLVRRAPELRGADKRVPYTFRLIEFRGSLTARSVVVTFDGLSCRFVAGADGFVTIIVVDSRIRVRRRKPLRLADCLTRFADWFHHKSAVIQTLVLNNAAYGMRQLSQHVIHSKVRRLETSGRNAAVASIVCHGTHFHTVVSRVVGRVNQEFDWNRAVELYRQKVRRVGAELHIRLPHDSICSLSRIVDECRSQNPKQGFVSTSDDTWLQEKAAIFESIDMSASKHQCIVFKSAHADVALFVFRQKRGVHDYIDFVFFRVVEKHSIPMCHAVCRRHFDRPQLGVFPATLTHQNKILIAKWLPFYAKKALVRRVPSLEQAVRCFDRLKLVSLASFLSISVVQFDGFGFNAAVDDAGFVTSIKVYRRTLRRAHCERFPDFLGGSGRCVTMAQIEVGRVSRKDYVSEVLNWILNSFVGVDKLKITKNMYCTEKVSRDLIRRKVKNVVTSEVFSPDLAVVTPYERHTHYISCYDQFDLDDIIECLLNAKRPIGSELQIFLSGGHEYVLNARSSPMLHRLLFDMQYADLEMTTPTGRLFVFRVVPKESE